VSIGGTTSGSCEIFTPPHKDGIKNPTWSDLSSTIRFG
jgi:hypothetical protein